jgi:hypothetical protein
MSEKLTMTEFLAVVRDWQTATREALKARGYHPNVIYAKAEKAARKGYTEYGVVADRPWLTSAGEAFLTNRESPTQ